MAAATGRNSGSHQPNGSRTSANPKPAIARTATPATAIHGAKAKPSSEPQMLQTATAVARPAVGTAPTILPLSTDCTAAAWRKTPGAVPLPGSEAPNRPRLHVLPPA